MLQDFSGWREMTRQTDLHFLAPGGRTPFHQPQDVQTHVVLTAPPEGEAEARRPTIQVHAVIPGVTLGHKGAVSEEEQFRPPVVAMASSPLGVTFDPFCSCELCHTRAQTGWTCLGEEAEG